MKEIGSWLVKDPIATVAWLNFDHAHSNSKKWRQKIKLPQMKVFLEKQLIKFSCTYQPISSCKNWLSAGPELWRCAIFEPKMAHLSWTKFFWKNYWYHFHLPISPFHCAKFFKILIVHHFWAQNRPFAQMRIFSGNLLISLVPLIHACLHAKSHIQILIYQ